MRRRREPTQERSRATVERILVAARGVLAERGYAGASTNRIAAAAGVGPGTLYQYFPDKDAIVDRVVADVAQEMESRILAAFLASLRAEDTVRANLEALLDALGTDAALLRTVAAHVPGVLEARRREFAARVDQMVAGVLLAESRDLPAATVAWVLVRTVEHVTVSWVVEAPDIPRETVLDELTAVIGGYLARRR
ncbi:TetR/AcrR family transcriptional regulator [Actinomycetospora soli]|uniref:TetR/AcrR family transcriptional regulator n=1 Tax=Actinomycetospora soli TaxID=2893887 RepID=UPI001E32F1F6|nr:TetR/AcrR family transcriptional regulator [Actinomycetospora soli]MCD2185651.1 TetR/AcrR family transcriptional regulator [Actinomycetospora soli]